MSTAHDIYNPPPAPVPFVPPPAEPLRRTRGDLVCLVTLLGLLVIGATWAWAVDAMLGLGVTIGGVFVILESWFAALSFLHRHPAERPVGRWMIFLAALVPWLLSLAFAAALLIGLFAASDWAS